MKEHGNKRRLRIYGQQLVRRNSREHYPSSPNFRLDGAGLVTFWRSIRNLMIQGPPLLLLLPLLGGCGMRDNEIGYRMAMEEGWETAAVEPTDDRGWIGASPLHIVKINHISGDSCEYYRDSSGLRHWVKKPYTWWDSDLAIYRALHQTEPRQRPTVLQAHFKVDHRGRALPSR